MKIECGFRGALYLVFDSEQDAEEYNSWLSSEFGVCYLFASFGGLFNAICLEG